MNLEIVYRQRVENDLMEHFAFIHKDKPEPAERFLRVAEESFDRLAVMPSIGSRWESKRSHLAGIRFYPMPNPYRNYIIFYRAAKNFIEILAVLHGARDLETAVVTIS